MTRNVERQSWLVDVIGVWVLLLVILPAGQVMLQHLEAKRLLKDEGLFLKESPPHGAVNNVVAKIALRPDRLSWFRGFGRMLGGRLPISEQESFSHFWNALLDVGNIAIRVGLLVVGVGFLRRRSWAPHGYALIVGVVLFDQSAVLATGYLEVVETYGDLRVYGTMGALLICWLVPAVIAYRHPDFRGAKST